MLKSAGNFLMTMCQLFLFAVAFSGIAGAIADFFTPVAPPFNCILCIGSAAATLFLLVLFLAFRGQGLGLASFCLLSLAAGFGAWWALPAYKGSPKRGFLAQHVRLISDLQTKVLAVDAEPEQLQPENSEPLLVAPLVLPTLQGNEEELVKEFLGQTLGDPAGMEIVGWGEPSYFLLDGEKRSRPVGDAEMLGDYKPAIVLYARIRAKNQFGAKAISDLLLLSQDGRVTQSVTLDRGLFALQRAKYFLQLLGMGRIAAERADGKLTTVIVRGKISRHGRPVTKDFKVTFGNENSETRSIISPPRYEVSGVTPGQCIVKVDHEGEKREFRCVVTVEQEVQTFDFDLTADDARQQKP